MTVLCTAMHDAIPYLTTGEEIPEGFSYSRPNINDTYLYVRTGDKIIEILAQDARNFWVSDRACILKDRNPGTVAR